VSEGPPRDLRPTQRFSDRAGDYARFRPTYAPEAIDAVLRGLGEPRLVVAADVGAGTGISATLLADRGATVVAVEPNRDMREAATPHPRIRWVDGTAEATGLPAASVDLVLCAQAFHWFRPREALAEFARVLRPGGRVALLWNARDEQDAVTSDYGGVVREARTAESEGIPPIAPPPTVSGLSPAREAAVAGHAQALDLEGLLGRARSASYVPRTGPEHDDVVRRLRALHAAHADAEGRVRLVYRTRLFLLDRVADGLSRRSGGAPCC
jgi:SAM-dependent methyltransferase